MKKICEKCKEKFTPTLSKYQRFCNKCYELNKINKKEVKMGNTINCSTFLKQESNLRASPEAVTGFKEKLEEYGKELIEKYKEIVERKRKKTIQLQEIEEVQ